jgi:tRNA ligase
MSHAQAGEVWLRKYLAELGKEEKDMAQELWDKNWTAIAEVCLLALFFSSSHIAF